MQAQREWLTVTQFLARYKGRVGRSTVYDCLQRKILPSVKLGNRILIPADALDRLLAEASGAGQGGQDQDAHGEGD